MPHIHEKIDFTVEVFIIFQNKVLLRLHDKYKFWLSVGGHIELAEDPVQAALREVKEEVGLEIELFNEDNLPQTSNPDFKFLIRPQFLNRHRINEQHEHVTLIYFAKAKTDQLTLSQNEKTDECRWFRAEELNDPAYGIREEVKLMARTALNKLK